MNNRISRQRVIISFLIYASIVTATWGDSIFSINGLGELAYPIGGQARGMGGVNLAFLDGRGVSLINPAITGTVDTTTVAGLFLFEQRRVKNSFARSTIYSWGPRFLHLIIPLSFGMVLGGGIAPFSDVNFHLTREEEVFGEAYTLDVAAEGGTRLGSLTLAKNIGNRLYLGLAVNLIFGSITEEWKRVFANPEFVSSNDRCKSSYYGQAYIGGIAIRPHPRLTLGAMHSRSGNIKATTERRTVSGILEEEEKQLDFPHAYGLGLTYQLTPRLTIGGDMYTRLWEKFRSEGTQIPTYKNTTRFSFGCELTPSGDKMAPFFMKVPWRAGLYHEPGYYEDESGNRVSETFFTLGTSLFFKEDRGAVDLAFEVGRRGDIAENGAQEWVFRQSFSIVGWERWFQKREY